MATLTIELPAEIERKLREQAARRNASVESLVAEIVVERARLSWPGEFDVTDDEIAVIQEAVNEVRSSKIRS